MNSRRLFIVAVFVGAFIVAAWIFYPRGTESGRATSRPAPASAGNASVRAAPGPGHPANEEPSHLADQLNAGTGDIHADLRILNEIFRQYRSSTRSANPVGENAEVTAVLTGRNNLGFAFIPPNHPAINGRGELCDRWGTPFFFHQLSGTQMEIRSAGPDRQLWTADDEILTPGLLQPKL